MPSPPEVEPFKGTGWEECENFIVSIRNRAFWEGKQRDSAWMADFAATNFSRNALSWHSRLPEDVRQDWSKLEIALLDRWPPPEEDNKPRLQPTPAATPLLNHDDRRNHPLQGILKAVLFDSNTSLYVNFAKNGSEFVCCLTENVNEALPVRCSSLSTTTLLERIDQSGRPSWLVVRWKSKDSHIGSGSTGYATMPCIDAISSQPPWEVGAQWQLMTCTVTANGEVIPVWLGDKNGPITLSAFVAYPYIYLASDPVAYGQKWQEENQAKLFIVPTS